MCQTANFLRWQLYQASRHYEPSVYAPVVPDEETLAAIRLDQATGEHVGALAALREHIAGCEECRQPIAVEMEVESWYALS